MRKNILLFLLIFGLVTESVTSQVFPIGGRAVAFAHRSSEFISRTVLLSEDHALYGFASIDKIEYRIPLTPAVLPLLSLDQYGRSYVYFVPRSTVTNRAAAMLAVYATSSTPVLTIALPSIPQYAPVIAADGRIFIPSADTVYCYTGQGKKLWQTKLPTSFSEQPRISEHGELIGKSDDGASIVINPFGEIKNSLTLNYFFHAEYSGVIFDGDQNQLTITTGDGTTDTIKGDSGQQYQARTNGVIVSTLESMQFYDSTGKLQESVTLNKAANIYLSSNYLVNSQRDWLATLIPYPANWGAELIPSTENYSINGGHLLPSLASEPLISDPKKQKTMLAEYEAKFKKGNIGADEQAASSLATAIALNNFKNNFDTMTDMKGEILARIRAIRFLGDLGSTEAAPNLVFILLNDVDYTVRQAALSALADIGFDPEGIVTARLAQYYTGLASHPLNDIEANLLLQYLEVLQHNGGLINKDATASLLRTILGQHFNQAIDQRSNALLKAII